MAFDETNSPLDMGKIQKIMQRVCRIEVKLQGIKTHRVYGTGCLVEADLVLTNWHVLKHLYAIQERKEEGEAWALPKDVSIRFDYSTKGEGVTNNGIDYALARQWLVASDASLDYAIIRLGHPVGELPIDQYSKRGWFELQQTGYKFEPESAIYIFQHPKGKPLQYAGEKEAVVELNHAGRVIYKTGTDYGSSGGPCFNYQLELVAVHCERDGSHNKGIPIDMIVAHLDEQDGWPPPPRMPLPRPRTAGELRRLQQEKVRIQKLWKSCQELVNGMQGDLEHAEGFQERARIKHKLKPKEELCAEYENKLAEIEQKLRG